MFFFVISGYLITGIILKGLERESFSLTGFYLRRARRILPALFAVMAASLPAAWFLLLPSDMEAFARSLMAVAAFSSNFLFWMESGYFEAASELKPLMHTWSLAVEEQFYLLYPLLMLSCAGVRRRTLLIVLMLLLIASLVAAEWIGRSYPSAAFFLLPTRAWELLLGALAAWALHHGYISQPARWLAGPAGALGLAMILYAVFLFDGDTATPSVMTLIPTGGALLVIVFARPGSPAHWLLAARPLVAAGLISYSLYLWHQPLLAFARHYSLLEPSLGLKLGMVAVSFPLAFVTWRYVEQPFRQPERIAARHVFRLAAGVSAIFICLGFAGHAREGFAERLPDGDRWIAAYKTYDKDALYRSGTCFLTPFQTEDDFAQDCEVPGQGGIMIWGDSHAAALYPGLKRLHGDITQLTVSACPPLLADAGKHWPNCPKMKSHIFERLEALQPRRLYLHATWPIESDRVPSLEATLEKIREKVPGVEIVVVGLMPRWSAPLPDILIERGHVFDETLEYARNKRFRRLRLFNRNMSAQAARGGALFFDPLSTFCQDDGHCLVSVVVAGEHKLLAWDIAHLTYEGALVATDGLAREFGESPPAF